jgi:hypothetical protein
MQDSRRPPKWTYIYCIIPKDRTIGRLWNIWTEILKLFVYLSGLATDVHVASWLDMTHTSHKDTEQSTIEASITLDGVTLTDPLIRWSPNEWSSVCREIPVSADKMYWTSNKRAKWTPYNIRLFKWRKTTNIFLKIANIMEYVSILYRTVVAVCIFC